MDERVQPEAASMAEVPQFARWQGGVFTRAQALAEGWTERQVRRRMATGAWARVAGQGLTGRARAAADAGLLAWAACLTWPNAVVSHQTAGLLHGFPLDRPEVAHVLVRDGLRRAFRIRAHHGRLGSADVDTWDGLAVTAPRRTALDCLAGLPPDQGLDLWAWLTSRGVITRQELALEVREGTGRHGTPALLALLTATRDGAVSVAELRLHGLLRRAGILGWRAGAEILHDGVVIAVVDLLFEQRKVVVEVDGWRSHRSYDAFVSDRRRQNKLVAAGYQVLRFTWDDLVNDPDGVVRQVRAAVA